MEQKDTLQELFNGYTPDLEQDDLFMQRLEKKLQAAGLYSPAIRPAMNECAKIMTRIHHYNAEHVRQKYRTALPDGKRPPELMALENASRELLNYLKEPGDVLPWDNAEEAEQKRVVLSNKHGNL